MTIEKKVLKISGMHCASCVVLIENSLKKEKGVKAANVNFASEKLYLEYDSAEADLNKIKKALKGLGYEASQEDDHHKIEKEKETKKLKKRFVVALFFSLPIIYLAMGGMISLPVPELLESYGTLIQFVSATVVIVACFNIWKSGLSALKGLHPNMDSLILVGTATAYFYSSIVSFLSFLGFDTEPMLYYEGAAFILVFISLGKYLEAVTKGKTSEAIKKLMGLQPKRSLYSERRERNKSLDIGS